FAIEFDQASALAVVANSSDNDTFRCCTRSLLTGCCCAFLAKPFECFFKVAGSFDQRFFAIHHCRSGLFAQFLDHGSGNLCHFYHHISLNCCESLKASLYTLLSSSASSSSPAVAEAPT